MSDFRLAAGGLRPCQGTCGLRRAGLSVTSSTAPTLGCRCWRARPTMNCSSRRFSRRTSVWTPKRPGHACWDGKLRTASDWPRETCHRPGKQCGQQSLSENDPQKVPDPLDPLAEIQGRVLEVNLGRTGPFCLGGLRISSGMPDSSSATRSL